MADSTNENLYGNALAPSFKDLFKKERVLSRGGGYNAHLGKLAFFRLQQAQILTGRVASYDISIPKTIKN